MTPYKHAHNMAVLQKVRWLQKSLTLSRFMALSNKPLLIFWMYFSSPGLRRMQFQFIADTCWVRIDAHATKFSGIEGIPSPSIMSRVMRPSSGLKSKSRTYMQIAFDNFADHKHWPTGIAGLSCSKANPQFKAVLIRLNGHITVQSA